MTVLSKIFRGLKKILQTDKDLVKNWKYGQQFFDCRRTRT